MIKLISIALLIGITFTSCSVTRHTTPQDSKISASLEDRLKDIPQVTQVTKMSNTDHFTENYELWFEQHTDPSNLSSPTFRQRVLIAHVSDTSTVIVELQGYHIYTPKSGELANLLQANQITIEHRYFANSTPKGELNWETLTVANAAADQHIIIAALKAAIYPKNTFISTGISKGGQTTMIHRSIYPSDVDGSVCYVAPLNFEREDPRIYTFLNSVGTQAQRDQVKAFQVMCFERKQRLLPLLQGRADANSWQWDIDLNHAFELYVLEYSFAFWQWGAYTFTEIPKSNATDEEILDHVLSVSGVSFFEKDGVEKQRSFFWAALTEMGIYGYESAPFKEYLTQKENYLFDFTLPNGKTPVYSKLPMKNVNDFIQNRAENMIFIYGELDTWSATGVQLSESAKERGLRKFVAKNAHHGTRIKSFPAGEREAILRIINSWVVPVTD
ncbi:MAG: hypothetical protein ACI837_002190 [Crocinitomicaceae bacterium]|jgi:hypothetical protein